MGRAPLCTAYSRFPALDSLGADGPLSHEAAGIHPAGAQADADVVYRVLAHGAAVIGHHLADPQHRELPDEQHDNVTGGIPD
jgi:hypothetical protein